LWVHTNIGTRDSNPEDKYLISQGHENFKLHIAKKGSAETQNINRWLMTYEDKNNTAETTSSM
jgi:hypothetical protein